MKMVSWYLNWYYVNFLNYGYQLDYIIYKYKTSEKPCFNYSNWKCTWKCNMFSCQLSFPTVIYIWNVQVALSNIRDSLISTLHNSGIDTENNMWVWGKYLTPMGHLEDYFLNLILIISQMKYCRENFNLVVSYNTYNNITCHHALHVQYP